MGERRRVAMQRRGEPSVWWDQSGKASMRGILALVVVVGMVYFGVKLIPARISAAQFADAVRDEVVFAGGRRASDETIRQILIDVAVNLGLQIERSSITIRRPGRNIVVEVDYTIVLEFVGGYTYQWNFSPTSQAPLIF